MKTTYDELARLAEAATPGPWRWEFNAYFKNVHLVGGVPRFDLTVMDFTRWGMGGAGIRLRDLSHNGLALLHKLQDRPDWIAPFAGREHHKSWCADVTHPDAKWIASANPATIKAMHADLVKAQADRDALVEALEVTRLRLRSALGLAKCDDGFMDGQCADAEAALARVKEGA